MPSAPASGTAGSGAVNGFDALAGTKKPSATKRTMAPILTAVRTFWVVAPPRKPKWLISVRPRMSPAATTWPPASVQVQPRTGTLASTWSGDEKGKK